MKATMTQNKAIEQAYKITATERKRLEKLMLASYQEAIDKMQIDLRKFNTKYLSGVKQTEYYTKVSGERLEQLIMQAQRQYNIALNKVKRLQYSASELSISNVYYRQLYIMNWTEGKIFSILPPEYIEATVYGTMSKWKELASSYKKRYTDRFGDIARYPVKSGTLLSAVLNKNKVKDLNDLESLLTRSMIQGDSYTKQAKGIQGLLDSSYKHSLSIARTEGHRAMMSGNMAMTNFARSKGVDVRRKIVATLDNKTREQSGNVDSKIENKDGFFVYPGGVLVAIPGNSGVAAWDINDREAVINTINGEEPKARRAKNPTTGETEIIDYKDFNTWAKENNLAYDKNGILKSTS